MRYQCRCFKYAVLMFCAAIAQAHDGGFDRPGPQPGPLALEEVVARAGESRSVTIELTDAETGKALPGLIRIRNARDELVPLRGLLSRATGIHKGSLGAAAFSHMDSWSVLPEAQKIDLPARELQVEAFSGLEWETATAVLSAKARSLTIPLKRIYNRHQAGYVSGNVHLHLKHIGPRTAERYSTEVTQADGCDVVFFSYLERAKADQHYTSNRFTREDLSRFHEQSGVIFGWGEEYRHNFPGQPGYGHVMMLDLEELILPASFGPDIMKRGNDDGTLRPGIEAARAQGATTLWCHNTRGLEDIPSWLSGLIDGQTIFDQGSTGTYEEGPYRLLNVGLHVPFATGTDWFLRDMAMTYVQSSRPANKDSFLMGLRQGRSFITNGPLLTFSVDGKGPGSVIETDGPETVRIEASAVGRKNFGSLELLVNGKPAVSSPATLNLNHHRATITFDLPIEEPVWIAVRIPLFEGSYDKPDPQPVGFNAYGRPLFAHSSPVYVNVKGKDVFIPDAADSLIRELEDSKTIIKNVGQYTNDSEREAVLRLYDDAIATLQHQYDDHKERKAP